MLFHSCDRSAGKTKVSISVTCDFLLPGTTGSVVSYNASKTILVVPDPPLALVLPMTWLFPPFYTTTSLLPRSANSLGEPDSLDLESSIGYSLLRGSSRSGSVIEVASIIDGSKIRTGESNAVDCIQAKDHSTGRTEIASCLRVAEVGCRVILFYFDCQSFTYEDPYLCLHLSSELYFITLIYRV